MLKTLEQNLPIIQRSCAILAFLIHFPLTLLIMLRSPKSLGPYKYLLIYISVFELIYALLDVLVLPDLYTIGSSYMLVLDSNKTILPIWTLYWIDLMFCGMLGCSMAIFCISFIYRYLAVKGSHLLKSFTSWKLLIWIASPLFFSVIWMTITKLTLTGNQYTDRLLYENFLKPQSVGLDEVVYIGPTYYPTENEIDWIPIIGMMVLTMMIFTSISTIIYFAAKSYEIMSKLVLTSSNSHRYRSHQMQLLNSLVIQSIIPFVLMHLPASCVFLMTFANCGDQIFARIFSVTVALYPVLDPLPTIFVVKCYRNAVVEMICSRRRSEKMEARSSTAYQVPINGV